MEKLIYLLWPLEQRTPARHHNALLHQCAPRLLALGARKLTINIDDQFATAKSPAPKFYRDPDICAQVSIWLDHIDERDKFEKILKGAGYRIAGYLVEESVYTDYGDNQHSGPRNWPDGERSPCVLLVTLLSKPKRFTREQWIKRWHGVMSPVSERLQPRQRYVRNVIQYPVTDEAPPFAGIVEEAWPSAEHIANPYLFYRAGNIWQLISHVLQLLRAILHFHNPFKIRSVIMSEYLLKTSSAKNNHSDR